MMDPRLACPEEALGLIGLASMASFLMLFAVDVFNVAFSGVEEFSSAVVGELVVSTNATGDDEVVREVFSTMQTSI